jgi:RNase P subunit RPR2
VEEVIEKQIGKEFHICDKCRYGRGFHVSFERRDDHQEIVLICPGCGQHYRVGWKIATTEIA